MKDTVISAKKTLRLLGKLVSLDTPLVMGILNVTPDSFFKESRHNSEQSLLLEAENMLNAGAEILDIGGYSSRPGAEHISLEEEMKRTISAVKSIVNHFPGCAVSIDTFRAEVANAAVSEGAAMVNDISGGSLDKDMFAVVGKLKVPYVLTHLKGTPQTMAQFQNYTDVTVELIDYFQKKIHQLRALGCTDILIDPGFGFAKSISQNAEVLRNLDSLHILECPLLVGLSRKSMVYKTLGVEAKDALNGTTVLHTIALQKNVSVLRVHDVKEAKQAISLVQSVFGKDYF